MVKWSTSTAAAVSTTSHNEHRADCRSRNRHVRKYQILVLTQKMRVLMVGHDLWCGLNEDSRKRMLHKRCRILSAIASDAVRVYNPAMQSLCPPAQGWCVFLMLGPPGSGKSLRITSDHDTAPLLAAVSFDKESQDISSWSLTALDWHSDVDRHLLHDGPCAFEIALRPDRPRQTIGPLPARPRP